jgi:carboxypeptidase D
VATTCPLLWDVLGFPGSFEYSPTGATVYFNRADVKKAINAPANVDWAECSGPVYANPDGNSYESDHGIYSGLTVLPGVIERSKRTIIGHGNLDMILIANGTLLTIQNMTWNGAQGFSAPPSDDFFVPYHNDYELGTLAAAGVMGKTRTERGLTFVEINLSGHMVPQYQPSASYRHMEYLLGRIPSLNSTLPFTKSNDGLEAQPPGPVGGGR